jgi:hypothetical protein
VVELALVLVLVEEVVAGVGGVMRVLRRINLFVGTWLTIMIAIEDCGGRERAFHLTTARKVK